MSNPLRSFNGRECRKFGFTALALAFFVLALPAITLAHAALVKSEPADGTVAQLSPSRIMAWFDQELEPAASGIGVFDAQGRRVDGGKGGVDLNDPSRASMGTTLPAALAPGRYTVRWHVTSAADGHPISGEFVFEIQ